jgi:hypothetical protein
MAGASSKAKAAPKRAAPPAQDELLQHRHKQWAMDHSTKVVTSLGDSVLTVAISTDEVLFAGAGTSGVARIFSVHSGEQLAAVELSDHINAVGLTRTASGAKLATGDLSGALSLFDLEGLDERPQQQQQQQQPQPSGPQPAGRSRRRSRRSFCAMRTGRRSWRWLCRTSGPTRAASTWR